MRIFILYCTIRKNICQPHIVMPLTKIEKRFILKGECIKVMFGNKSEGINMSKYFGTDGIRGKFGEKLDENLAYRTGLALGGYFGSGKYVVGRDTRVSGKDIEDALVKGITDMGGRSFATWNTSNAGRCYACVVKQC